MTEAERITSSYTDANYGLGAKMTIPLKIAMKKVILHYIDMLGKIMQKGFYILYQDIQHCY